MSKAGVRFTAAIGSKIRNYCGRLLTGMTGSKEEFVMSVQVTDARRNLASFLKMLAAGNDITVSRKKGCFITNEKTDVKIPTRSKKEWTPELDLCPKKGQSYGKFG